MPLPSAGLLIRCLAVILTLVVVAGCGTAHPSASTDPAVVHTLNGPVRGVQGEGFRVFQGIYLLACIASPLQAVRGLVSRWGRSLQTFDSRQHGTGA